MHITTFKYKWHITLSHSTHSKPHHTSHTAFQPSVRMTPCIIWRQTIPHHSVFHNHISHLAVTAHHHSTSQTHFTPRLTLHDITFSISPYRTYSASLFHIIATLGWIRHNIPHLALQNIPHHTKFHTTLFHITPCDVWSGGIEICGMMWDVVWCAVPEMCRFDVKCCWDVEYITHCHCIWHIIPPSLHCIIPHQTPSLTLFQTIHVTPSFLTVSHISYHTSTSRSTLFHFAIPYFKSHRIGHIMHHTTSRIAPYFTSSYVPHSTTFHVVPATFHIPPYIGHIMRHTTTSRITPHFTHCRHRILHASFHHIWPWSHPIPHPTTMFHITFHITDQYTATFYKPPLTTSRIKPPPLSRIAPCHSPHSTSFHIAHVPHSMPQHTHQSTLHTTFHNPILVWETRTGNMWSVLLCGFHSQTTFYTTYKTKRKNDGEKVQLHS